MEESSSSSSTYDSENDSSESGGRSSNSDSEVPDGDKDIMQISDEISSKKQSQQDEIDEKVD